jgi:RNA polymerase sigma-70 factor, ECF subfamily
VFISWLKAMAVNLCRNEIERRIRSKNRDERALAERPELLIPVTAWEVRSVDSLLGDIGACLALLRPEHAQVLKLTYFDGYSYREIAGLLDVDVEEVRTRLQRARINFRKVWEERRKGGVSGVES